MHDDLMNRPDDHEAAMARADLYKLANYSMKLFKMIREGQELEGWVQAKITKSADYIASVYHYMEYEMKASEYGEKLEMSDVYSESVRRAFEQKLMEAKKVAAKKKAEVKKKEEELDEAKFEKSGVRADKKKGKVEKSTRKSYFVKLEKEGKSRGVTTLADEGESEGEVRDRMKRDNAGWTVASIRRKDDVDEAVNIPSPPDGATAAPKKDPKTGRYPKVTSGPNKGKEWSPKTPGPTNPAMKETSHQEKTTMKHVKNPTAGEKKAAKDIKPGIKGYKDRIDMLKSAEKDGRLKEASKPDFLDMDKDGDRKEPMKKAVADKKKKPVVKK